MADSAAEGRVREEVLRAIYTNLVQVAREQSDDPSTQNAAYYRGRYGANRVVVPWKPGVSARVLTDRDFKLAVMEHAERTAILAGRKPSGGVGVPLFALWAACPDCARAIVTEGVSEVYTLSDAVLETPERWRKAVDLGREVLSLGGVKLIQYTPAEPLGVSFLFDGKDKPV